MYTGKQFKNEAGNRVPRQVEVGTRQGVKMKDGREYTLQKCVLQLGKNAKPKKGTKPKKDAKVGKGTKAKKGSNLSQPPSTTISIGNPITLNKGTSPGSPASWALENTSTTGACHHIINFDTGLQSWFKDMSAAYNGVVSEGKRKTNLEQIANKIKGKIRTSMESLGASLPISVDEPISANQSGFSWRPGNLFVGVQPSNRSDDPKTRHEFVKKTTDNNLDNVFQEGKTIFEEMQKINTNTKNALKNPIDDNIEQISSISPTFATVFVTDHHERGNIHWTVEQNQTWGAPGAMYRLL